MTVLTTTDPAYIRHGLVLSADVLLVDLTEPRTLHVKGVNTVTGETKDYLLKVTQSGKLLLI
jgi:hypothetical protein